MASIEMNLFRHDLPKPAAWPPPDDRAGAAAIFRYVRMHDPVGHQVHAAVALLYLFLLPLATAPKEVALGVLLSYTVLRLPHTWRCYTVLARDPLVWAVTAWVAWQAASITWSLDPEEGLDELIAMRTLLIPLALWPVLDRIGWLIGAALAGIFAHNAVQAAQQLHWFGLQPSMNDRLTGLIHPIKTGAWCGAAIAWHVSAILLVDCRKRSGWWRWITPSLVGLAAAAWGLIYSGSRGPWLAAAVALVVGCGAMAVRRPLARRRILLLGALAIIVAAASWPVASSFITRRVDQALGAMRGASHGEFVDEGYRFANWIFAWQIFQQAPLQGAGAGSYRIAAAATPRLQQIAESDPHLAEHIIMPHPHSSYLYVLACTGVVGAVLFGSVLVLTLWRSWRNPPDHPYVDGTLLAMVTWLVGAQIECYNLNGHHMGLLGLVMAASMRFRPPPRSSIHAVDEADERLVASARPADVG